jgi:hypothetical protein
MTTASASVLTNRGVIGHYYQYGYMTTRGEE